jgi:hypothetical protein
MALGWLNLYIVGHYWLEAANDIFNDVGTCDIPPLSKGG